MLYWQRWSNQNFALAPGDPRHGWWRAGHGCFVALVCDRDVCTASNDVSFVSSGCPELEKLTNPHDKSSLMGHAGRSCVHLLCSLHEKNVVDSGAQSYRNATT